MMSDLFPGFVPSVDPPGFRYVPELIDSRAATALVAQLAELELAPFRFQGWLGKRLTASFGWRYDFDDGSFTLGAPIPQFLLPLRQRAADFAGLPVEAIVQLLVTRYDPGAGIGWHRDRSVFEHVIGVSLGNPATLRFRRRRERGFDRFAARLAPGSAYSLTGAARRDWEHSIAPMEVPRWSITFRTLSQKGRLAAARAD